MTPATCPECGRNVSDCATACVHCGSPLSAKNTPTGVTPSLEHVALVASMSPFVSASGPHASAAVDEMSSPFFLVTTPKFIVLYLCTLTFYEMFWAYRNWQCIKRESGEDLSPFWRAFFLGIWNFSLFARIKSRANADGIAVTWNPVGRGLMGLLLNAAFRLPGRFWLLGFLGILAAVPAQQTAQLVNKGHVSANRQQSGGRFSAADIATTVIGGIVLILAVIGTFLPE